MPISKSFKFGQFLILSCMLAFGSASAQEAVPDYVIAQFGAPPAVPTGELSSDLNAAVKTAFLDLLSDGVWGRDQTVALTAISESGDPRLVWLISDLMRFVTGRELNRALSDTAGTLLGKDFPGVNNWGVVTDHLLAWDIPAPPNYLENKRAIFTTIIPGWEQIFVEGDIDWRLVSWGGVLIDNRPFDTTDDPCNCIPAADNPEVTGAAEATWQTTMTLCSGSRSTAKPAPIRVKSWKCARW